MRILDYEQIIVKIQNWIKNYVTSAKVNGVIVGMSGGIDSSVTTTLCTKAIGVKNVIGLSSYTLEICTFLLRRPREQGLVNSG